MPVICSPPKTIFIAGLVFFNALARDAAFEKTQLITENPTNTGLNSNIFLTSSSLVSSI